MPRRARFAILAALLILGGTLSLQVTSATRLAEEPETEAVLRISRFVEERALPDIARGNDAPTLLNQLRRETEGAVRVAYHARTGKVRFLGTDKRHPIPRPETAPEGAGPEEIALHFLSTYAPLFGLKDPSRELLVMRIREVEDGHSFVRFQQIYQGIPVMGGELNVQMDAAGNVLSALVGDLKNAR